MTTTPLPPLPKSSPEQDALFDHLYEYGVSAEGVHQRLEKVCQAYAQQARADLEAENADLKRKLEEARTLLQGIVDTAADMARAALENKP